MPQNLKRAAIHQTRDGKWGNWGRSRLSPRRLLRKIVAHSFPIGICSTCRAPGRSISERSSRFLARAALAACVLCVRRGFFSTGPALCFIFAVIFNNVPRGLMPNNRFSPASTAQLLTSVCVESTQRRESRRVDLVILFATLCGSPCPCVTVSSRARARPRSPTWSLFTLPHGTARSLNALRYAPKNLNMPQFRRRGRTRLMKRRRMFCLAAKFPL